MTKIGFIRENPQGFLYHPAASNLGSAKSAVDYGTKDVAEGQKGAAVVDHNLP